MTPQLNEIDEVLEDIDTFFTPTNFKRWLLTAESDYENNLLLALIEDAEHFSSIPTSQDSTDSIRTYLSKAPIEPKLALRLTLNTHIRKLTRISQNKLTENLASDLYKQQLVNYICHNIKLLAVGCQSEVVFLPYVDIIWETLRSFENFMERHYGLRAEPESSLQTRSNYSTVNTETIVSHHIDRIFAHLTQKSSGLPGDLTPAEYLQFKDSLLKTILPGDEAPKVYNFKTPRISGESLRYSFSLLAEALNDDTPTMRITLARYLKTYFDKMKERVPEVLAKNFAKPKPKGYHYLDESQ
ncbi:hypothetical protein [Dyadobacter crusticola]|uniref:hypothetical protein n=1 Tax=Dyadobacter crusticola TaxID=292407 RepID=UPI0004E1CA89|nr:hypothetical protein [Dyadobacter crusticola]